MERAQAVLLIAGFGFFAVAVLIMGVWPYTLLKDLPMSSIEDLAAEVQPSFIDLADRYPESFAEYYGEPDPASYAKALLLGRDIYVGEACWHCHSQQIRPVSNEDLRWGPVSKASEYQNELQLPQLLGTRRVGPDLIREAGKHSNDWHAAHFYEPTNVVPVSVMPTYKWFFETRSNAEGDARIVPNERGLAIIAYVQWLGSWIESSPATFYYRDTVVGMKGD